MDTIRRIGNPLPSRDLQLYFLCDRSESMGGDNKLGALNDAMRDTTRRLAQVAYPQVRLLMRCISFGDAATWHISEAIPAQELVWQDLDVVPLDAPPLDIIVLLDASQSMGSLLRAAQVHYDMLSSLDYPADIRVRLACFDIEPRTDEQQGCQLHRLSNYTLGIWPTVSLAQFGEQVRELRPDLWAGHGCALADADSVELFEPLLACYDDPQRARILVLVSDEMGSAEAVPSIVAQLQQVAVTAHIVGLQGHSRAHELIAVQSEGRFYPLPAASHDITAVIAMALEKAADDMLRRRCYNTSRHGTLGAALDLLIHQFLAQPTDRRFLPPILVLLADSTLSEEISMAVRRLRTTALGRRAVRLAIAIGSQTPTTLRRFCGDVRLVIQVRAPTQLADALHWVTTSAVRAVAAPQIDAEERGVFTGYVQLPSLPQWDETSTPTIW
jgi:uncharacterized protein YegL